MKRLVWLLCFLPLLGYGQIKISELPEATTINDADVFLLIQSGTSKKIYYSTFKYDDSSVAIQIGDSLTLYRTEVANQIHDSIQAASFGTSISFGNQYELPVTNASVDGFNYSTNLTWNGTSLNVNKGTRNTFIGNSAGNSTTGTDNLFLGYQSGYTNVIGSYNTFSGMYSGYSNSTGNYNNFNGYYAGYTNSSGAYNTFLGSNSGKANTTGSYNTFIGYNSGLVNTTGNNNVFIGRDNSIDNVSGYNGVHIGNFAGYNNISGYENIFIGYRSGNANTYGYQNTFIGTYSGYSNTEGLLNSFYGFYSGTAATTGNNNVNLGSFSGYSTTTGNNNTFVGTYSGYNNIIGSGNVFLGYQAGQNETGDNKLYISNSSDETPLIYGNFTYDTVRINGYLDINGNTSITGTPAGNNREIQFNDNGSFGSSSNFTWNDTLLTALYGSNVFIGGLTGVDATNSATHNTSLGLNTLNTLTTGDFNTAMGSNALKVNNNSYNVGIGYRSLYNSTGANNTSIGSFALTTNISGNNNVSIGYESGNLNVGSGNIFLGYQAGYNETGSNKLYIENSNSTTPLIKGDFLTDELWFNVDTTHNEGHLVVDSNLYVNGRSIFEKYSVAAYLGIDSVVTTNVNNSTWSYLGGGENNKFSNYDLDGFGFESDTLQYQQSSTDYRDSVEFNIDYSGLTSTGSVNRTIFFAIQIKSIGESSYRVIQSTIGEARTSSASTYYVGPVSTSMPIWLKDGDLIQIVSKCAATTATVMNRSFKIYLREE